MCKKITRRKLESFLESYQTEEKILDIGSGGSAYGRLFPNRLTVDIDPERNPEIVADAARLPFEDASFSFILCTEMLEHVPEPQVVIDELHRVLKPGGKMVLTTRFVFPLHDTPHDYWRFTKYGLLRLFKNWEVTELMPDTQAFSTVGVMLQRIAFQTRLVLNRPMKFLVFVLAWLFDKANGLLVEEYGDIKRSIRETDIMPSGYFVVATKKDD
jgi:SAM-dependent methyltransferase